jgi:hypothetical protein
MRIRTDENSRLFKLCTFLIRNGATYAFIKDAENSIDFLLKQNGKPSNVFAAGEYIMLGYSEKNFFISYDYINKRIKVKEKLKKDL